MATKEVKLAEIDDLAPADYNPRRIDEQAAAGLQASLEAFGDIAGITYNARTGRLVTGHQRVQQLKAQGARLVTDDGLAVEKPDTGEQWRVRVVDWDEETERAANIAANNQHIAGTFTEALQPLLEQVREDIGEHRFEALRLPELTGQEKKPKDPPDEFKEYGEDIDTNRQCPKCGYRWSE